MQLAGWHNQISNNALLNRAAGSNLRMVRPSLMSVVKLPIICARNAWQNLNLFLAVRRRSHFTSASNWELPLLCSRSLTCTERMRTHLRLYLAGFYYRRERDHTKVKCIISYVLALFRCFQDCDCYLSNDVMCQVTKYCITRLDCTIQFGRTRLVYPVHQTLPSLVEVACETNSYNLYANIHVSCLIHCYV